MQLAALLQDLEVIEVRGSVDREVEGVTRDSRESGRTSVFVAIRGTAVDGHRFVSDVEAAAVVVEADVTARPGVAVVRVEDTRGALAHLAAALEGHPSHAMRVVGVTGTNGKTTVTCLVHGALEAAGQLAGRIGTLGSAGGAAARSMGLTTPEAPMFQRELAEMLAAGKVAALTEVSSIALSQRRVDATRFHLAVFTNLSRDHLDFHVDMVAYRDAKRRLFTDLLRPAGGLPRALLCADDSASGGMGAPKDHWTYGRSDTADLCIVKEAHHSGGVTLTVAAPGGNLVVRSPMLGAHNALNLTAALGVLLLLGIHAKQAAAALGQVLGVPGRLERVSAPGDPLVVVDYAHTPDAILTALNACREAVEGEVWIVFGCGGDRDIGKRPLMGRAAEAGAEHVVVTSDNPRSEDPTSIVEQVLGGLTAPEAAAALVDRADAIRHAVLSAGPEDAVLIAGKGHETYQELAGHQIDFDDRAVARSALEER
jgi:UDP-N-acetylmuramoyl-L-alanyl-D-glutamate--2,6-diaminopimelate ligase